MNTAQATSAATAANTPAPWPVNNAMALAWAANLGQAFNNPAPSAYGCSVPLVGHPESQTELEVFDPAPASYDATQQQRLTGHVRMMVSDKHSTRAVDMTRHEAAWLVRGLVDTIAASLVRDGKGPAAALAPTNTGMHRGELRVVASGPQHKQDPVPAQRLEQVLEALADATQILLAFPVDHDTRAKAQICIYAARNVLDLQALAAAEAQRQKARDAAQATACDYHGAAA